VRPACTAVAPDGSTYNLYALVLHAPINGTDKDNHWKYQISVCQNSLSCGNIDPAGYCQYYVNYEPFQFCIGSYDGIVGLNEGKGVQLVYKEPIEGRIGTVNIKCDPSGSLVSNVEAISPDKITDYVFSFSSSAACDTRSSRVKKEIN